MSAFMHELAARIRATTHVSKTPYGRPHRRDTCRASNTPRAAKSRKWVIAGLRWSSWGPRSRYGLSFQPSRCRAQKNRTA